jgi:single-strand DNA-binding protein
MRSLNKATLIGNLTRDPEVRQTSNGQAVATFSIATNRYWKDTNGEQNEETEYHDLVAWGKLAEVCQAYLKTGTAVYIEGRLKTRSWEGQDGHKRYKTEIIVSDLNILTRRKDNGEGPIAGLEDIAPVDNTPSISADAAPTPSSDDDKINIEDIPF